MSYREGKLEDAEKSVVGYEEKRSTPFGKGVGGLSERFNEGVSAGFLVRRMDFDE